MTDTEIADKDLLLLAAERNAEFVLCATDLNHGCRYIAKTGNSERETLMDWLTEPRLYRKTYVPVFPYAVTT